MAEQASELRKANWLRIAEEWLKLADAARQDRKISN
jgi:hypothetical protein